MQSAVNKSGRTLAKLSGFAILAFPILMAANCPGGRTSLTLTLSGCPTADVEQGDSFALTATVTDVDGNDVTANAIFEYVATTGATTLSIVTDANVGTVNIPVDAQLGAYVITATGTVGDATGSDECRFDVIAGAECDTNADCADGDVCNGTETCSMGVCADGTPLDCDDGLACTDDSCDAATGCENVSNCPAATPFCTADGCLECETNGDCDDGDACTVDTCDAAGACDNSVAISCDDGLDCTDDSCNSATGCANASNCPAETPICTAAGCVECQTNGDCAAGEVCTANACVPEGGQACTSDADCDDGLFCNGEETCVDTVCEAGLAPCDPDTQDCSEEDNTCTDKAGQVFNLTTDVDIIVGTGLSDLIRGVVQTIGSTLNAGDAIDGGASTDALAVTIVDTDYAPVAAIVRVEQIFAFNTDTGTLHTFNAVGINEVQELWTDRSLGPVEFTNIDHLAGVGTLDTGEDITATFSNTALGGDDDTVPVILSGTKSTSSEGVDIVIRSSGADGAENVVITTAGNQAEVLNSIADDGENDLETLVLNNSDPLEIRDIDSGFDTIDGAGSTADLDLELPNDDTDVTTGSGDDILRAAATSGDLSIDAGDGDDILISEMGIQGTLTNLETAEVDNNDTSLTVDLDNAPDLTQVTVNNTAAPPLDELLFSNLPDGFTGVFDTDVDIIIGSASTFSIHPDDEDGSSNVLSIQFMGNAGDVVFNDTLETGDIEDFMFISDVQDVTLNPADVFDGGGADTLEAVHFSGGSNFTLNSTLADTDTLTDVNAEMVTGNFIMNNEANDCTTEIDIVTGPGNDQLQGCDGNDNLEGGDGNDFLFGGLGNDDLDGGAGNDECYGDDGDDTLSLGSGNDLGFGGNGEDDLNGGDGNDDLEGGDDEDDLDGGPGVDRYIYTGAHDATADEDVAVLEPGSGGDVLRADVSAVCGSIVAAIPVPLVDGVSFFKGSVAAVAGNNRLIVLTGAGYADFTAAETAIEAANAASLDYIVVFLNNTNNTAEVWADDTSAVAGGCKLATLENLSTLGEVDNLVLANFQSF